MTDIFLGEFLGTMFLVLLGNGVVANVVFKKTIGAKSGFLAITVGWGLAVFMGVLIANAFSTGGHLNPAVTMMAWAKGDIYVDKAFVYFGSEIFGAIVGQLLVTVFYWQHIKEKENHDAVLAMHSTGPTHDKKITNILSEFIGTGVLVSVAMILGLSMNADGNAAMSQIMRFAGPLSMALVVLGIGISLGGTTGYAINPARDLGPRLVYTLMRYPGAKKSANWQYGWIPVVAPLAAGAIVGGFGRLI